MTEQALEFAEKPLEADGRLEPVVCEFCRKLMSYAVRGETVERPMHAYCAAVWTREYLVPYWPHDEEHRQFLDRWKRGWPQLDWETAWWSNTAFQGRGQPSSGENLVRRARTLRENVGAHAIAPTIGSANRLTGWARRKAGAFDVCCRVCRFHRQVYRMADVSAAVRQHHAEFPAHGLVYFPSAETPAERLPGLRRRKLAEARSETPSPAAPSSTPAEEPARGRWLTMATSRTPTTGPGPPRTGRP